MTNSEPRKELDLAPNAVEAIVTNVDDDGRLEVRTTDGGVTLRARVALPGYEGTVGDRVLLVSTSRGDAFVIGTVAAAPARLRVGPIEASEENGAIVLRRTDGTVVLKHDPSCGETRLGVAAGDLVLEAPEGALRFRAKKLDVDVEEIVQRTERMLTSALQIGWSVDRWDLRANRLKERAREALLEVDALLQTRAGRLRTLVKKSAQLLAERTTIRSKEDTAIDGKQVLLG
jgi:hypothetical protein